MRRTAAPTVIPSIRGDDMSRLLLVSIFVAALPASLDAQTGEFGAIERIALRAGLAEFRSKPRDLRISINPVMVAHGAAPGVSGTVRRPDNRTLALAREFGGSSRERASVISCPDIASEVPRCQLVDANVYVSLSDVKVDGSVASVTITFETIDKHGLQYETLQLNLRMVRGSWRVENVEQLGVS